MRITVYELQKRCIIRHPPCSGPGNYKTIGYFQNRADAEREKSLPIGASLSNCEWRITEHAAHYDEEQPDRVVLISEKEVSLGRTEFFL